MKTIHLRKLQTDTVLRAGVVFVALGISALALGADLTVGTAADMGEGYVPRAMAVALLAFGTLLVVLSLSSGSPAPPFSPVRGEEVPVRWRPLAHREHFDRVGHTAIHEQYDADSGQRVADLRYREAAIRNCLHR